MVAKEATTSKTQSLWLFFVLTFALSWLFWVLAALLHVAEPAPLVLALHYLGGLMPPLIAIILIFVRHTPPERRDYWQRLIEFKRIKAKWYAVIFLTAPLLVGLSVLLDVLAGGMGAKPEAAARFMTQPLAVVPFAVFMLLFGPLPEELAWRGYALERLQRRWNALTSSLLLGVAWTVWHMPLFFISGTYQHGLGLGTLGFWLFMADKIPQSVLMTWVFNNTRRSTLSAVLFHFVVNFLGELIELTARADFFYIVFWIVAAITVTILWGPQRLVRKGWR